MIQQRAKRMKLKDEYSKLFTKNDEYKKETLNES